MQKMSSESLITKNELDLSIIHNEGYKDGYRDAMKDIKGEIEKLLKKLEEG